MLDELIGFNAYAWRPRLSCVRDLAKEDLKRRGFQVKYLKVYEATDFNGIAVMWVISPV